MSSDLGIKQADTSLILGFINNLLYYKNLFRISELSILSTNAQINKKIKLLEMQIEFGIQPEQNNSVLKTNEHTQKGELAKLVQRFNEPKLRLLDEIFWYWPYDFKTNDNDLGYLHSVNNKIEEAKKVWEQHVSGSNFKIEDVHNLAIYYHFSALTAENEKLSGPTTKNDEQIRTYWSKALKYWSKLVYSPTFYSLLKERIIALNEPRLDPTFVEELELLLPKCILSINSHLSITYTQKQYNKEAKQHLDLISESGFKSADIEQSLYLSVVPTRERISSLCVIVEEEVNKDPRSALILINQFIEQTKSLLHGLTEILPESNPIIESIYDEIAKTIQISAISFRNKTEKYQATKGLLNQALYFSKSDSTKQKIRESLERVDSSISYDFKWCIEEYWNLPEDNTNLLEEAKRFRENDEYLEAIHLLSEMFGEVINFSHHPDTLKVVKSCLAVCFKEYSVLLYNNGMTDYDQATEIIIKNSFVYLESSAMSVITGSGLPYSSIKCVKCGNTIYSSSYYTRTYNGIKVAYDYSCSSELDREIDTAKRKFNSIKKTALDLLILADHFRPKEQAITKNLETIRKSATESNIYPSEIKDILKKYNLLTFNESIKFLLTSDYKLNTSIMQSVIKTIESKNQKESIKFLDELFVFTFTDEVTASIILPAILQSEVISNAIVAEYFDLDKTSKKQIKSRDILIHVIMSHSFHKTLFDILKNIAGKGDSNNSAELSKQIISALYSDVINLLLNFTSTHESDISKKIARIIFEAGTISTFFKNRLIHTVSDLIENNLTFGNSNLNSLPQLIEREFAILSGGIK